MRSDPVDDLRGRHLRRAPEPRAVGDRRDRRAPLVGEDTLKVSVERVERQPPCVPVVRDEALEDSDYNLLREMAKRANMPPYPHMTHWLRR